MQLELELNAKHLCSKLLSIILSQHDFGTYYEVNAVYDMDDAEASEWAFSIEGDEKGVLEFWEPEFNPNK